MQPRVSQWGREAHPVKRNKTKEQCSFSWLAGGHQKARALEPSLTSGLLGSSAGSGWEGSGRPAQPASVSMEVLIKWKEVIIKFTAVPQSTTVCVLLITYTGPRQRKWQPRQ